MNDLPPPPYAPPPTLPGLSESEIRQWNMWCHLSALSGLLVPFGSVLGPLVVWQIKKAEIPSVEVHGKAALNFKLTVLIAAVAAMMAMLVLSFFCIGWLLLPVIVLIGVAGVVFSIIAALKANEGKEYQYPWSWTLIS